MESIDNQLIELERTEKKFVRDLRWRTVIIAGVCGLGPLLILNNLFGGVVMVIVGIGTLIQYPYFKRLSDKRMKKIMELKERANKI